MSTENIQQLRPTSWLAKRLGLSVATIERLRVQKSPDLPPHVTIGRSVRYEEQVVTLWIRERLHPDSMAIESAPATQRRIFP